EEGNGPIPKGVWSGEEYDGYRGGCRLGRESRHLSADGNNEGHLPMHERGRKRRQPVVLTICPAVVDHDVLTLDKASFVQSLANDGDRMRIGSGRTAAEESNHRQPTLLRPRGGRPRHRRAAEQRDELASSQLIVLHSISHQPDRRISNYQGSVRGFRAFATPRFSTARSDCRDTIGLFTPGGRRRGEWGSPAIVPREITLEN